VVSRRHQPVDGAGLARVALTFTHEEDDRAAAYIRPVATGRFDPLSIPTMVVPWDEAATAWLQPATKLVVTRAVVEAPSDLRAQHSSG
jgi:hypothetical protein